MGNIGAAKEIREQIDDVVEGQTKPGTGARAKALSDVKWFLATTDGRAVGLHGLRPVIVPIEEAEIYDGRDNEEIKRRYFEAVLQLSLKVVPVPERWPLGRGRIT